jgi:hypothetical protein
MSDIFVSCTVFLLSSDNLILFSSPLISFVLLLCECELQRAFTTIVLLSDEFDGGETTFPRLDLKLKVNSLVFSFFHLFPFKM